MYDVWFGTIKVSSEREKEKEKEGKRKNLKLLQLLYSCYINENTVVTFFKIYTFSF